MEEPELIDQELERVALSIGIPPCPAILQAIADEMNRDEPSLAKIEQLISKDVGLSATLLKTINSPFYGLTDKISTLPQAINLLGLAMLSRTISELVLKQISLARDQVNMERFWDSSGKLASTAATLAMRLGINREAAYTYGLFQNCGIPILMQRFPDYKQTLALANLSADRKFTDIEDEAHGANHATIGYLLTKSWNLTAVISHAIRFHHDYSVFSAPDGKHPPEALKLIALGMLADYAVQKIFGQNFSLEWQKGGALALAHLGLDADQFEEMLTEVRLLMELG